jgi:oligosaccharide repeat unit polymerase
VCLIGAFSGGSRNSLLFAVAVPLVVAYLASGPLARRQALGLAAVALVLVAFASVVFAERISQRGGGETFYELATEDKPVVVKPVMPAYIAGTYGFETFRRVHDAFPGRYTYGYGGYQLTSMPDKAFPDGKPPVGTVFGLLSWDGPGSATWTVASYQGRAYADFGIAGVLLASMLLGVLFGGVYRLAREYPSVLTLVATGCAVYIAAFMVYDNLLSFSVAVVYDLTVVGVATALAARQAGARRDVAVAQPA